MEKGNLVSLLAIAAIGACRSREPSPTPDPSPRDAGMRKVPLSRPESDLVQFAAGAFKGRERRCKLGSLKRNFPGYDRDPDHQPIAVDAFAIDRRLVSCIDFDRCIESGRCAGNERLSAAPKQGVNRCDDGLASVSHEAALEYCRWRDMDLPTLYEWQRALRGLDGWRSPIAPEYDPAKFHVPELSTPEGVVFSVATRPAEWLRDQDCVWENKDASDPWLAHVAMPSAVFWFDDDNIASSARFRCVKRPSASPTQPPASPRKSG